jgi:Trypsin-like peptidase domain
MRREDKEAATRLLASCSALLSDDAGPRGTAFFVAPGYAVTAAHLVGVEGAAVRLSEGTCTWHGRVTGVRPPFAGAADRAQTYPAPDVALITIDDGPGHACARLGPHRMGTRVMARGYTRTFDHQAVTAETETFRLTGTLETLDPGCTLLKLGLGEVTKGMSGAPVLECGTEHVIGMLRTSRQLGSSLGGWVVPADLIRHLWPQEVGQGGDRFYQQDGSRGRQAHDSRKRSRGKRADAQSGLSIGKIVADVAPVITGGEIGTLHIENRSEHRQRPPRESR